MPPSEPLQEMVMRNVVSTLQGIVAGDTYWNTVVRVERKIVDPRQTNGIVLLALSPGYEATELDGGGSPTGVTRKKMVVDVYAYWEANTASDTAAQRLCADIERAMHTDRFRGGYAKNTVHFKKAAVQSEAYEPFAEIVMSFMVTFQHEFVDTAVQV